MLKTMVLCLLSFLFGVLTQKQWMWWAAPRTFDIFVPFACLHRSWACDQRKQVMPFAALWRCVRTSKETYRRWPICIWHGNFVFLSLPVFPWPRGSLFVSASEGCRQLLESLACSHLPYSEAELHKLSKLSRCADWSFPGLCRYLPQHYRQLDLISNLLDRATDKCTHTCWPGLSLYTKSVFTSSTVECAGQLS